MHQPSSSSVVLATVLCLLLWSEHHLWQRVGGVFSKQPSAYRGNRPVNMGTYSVWYTRPHLSFIFK